MSLAPPIRTYTLWLLAFCLLAVALRASVFSLPFISQDESTYILMGREITQGHAPYARYWTLKPPLGFLFYAGVISLFDTSIPAIRLAGSLYLALSAFVLLLAVRRVHSMAAGALAGLSLIILASALQLSIMMELIALLPLCLMLYALLRPNPRHWFAIGLCVGIAAMIRTNLAFFGIGALAAIFCHTPRQKRLRAVALLALGALLPLAACFAYYAHIGLAAQLRETLWERSFSLLLAHSPARRGRLGNLYSNLFCLAALISASAWLYRCRGLLHIRVLYACLLGGLISIYVIASAPLHYLVPLLPVLCAFIGIVAASLWARKKAGALVLLALLAACHAAPLFFLTGLYAKTRATTPRITTAAAYVNSLHLEGTHLYSPDALILNFLTRTLPASRNIHTSYWRLPRIMEQPLHPGYLTTLPEHIIVLDDRTNAFPNLQALIAENYALRHQAPEFYLYQKLP